MTDPAAIPLAYAPAQPPPSRTLLGHPPGLFVLFVVELWERFSYYGMRALLVLYLVAAGGGTNPGRGMTKEAAANLYGWYTGLAYLLPILGGLVADRLIGAHRSVLVGGALIALGHIALAVSGLGHLAEAGVSVFVLGLALIVIGTGHFKPNVSVMVGRLYPDGDPRRDGAFTIFYMGINVGAFASALVCGTLGERVGWHWGFGAAAVGMLMGLGIYLAARPRLLAGVGDAPGAGTGIDPAAAPAAGTATAAAGRAGFAAVGCFALALVLAATAALAFHLGVFGGIGDAVGRLDATSVGHVAMSAAGWALGVGIAAAAVWFVAAQPAGDRGATAVVFLFIVFNAVFWLAYEQAGTSLNLFASELTDRRLGSHEVPATWFQSVGALLIILLAPAFAALWSALDRRGRNPSQAVKVAVALFLLGGGYLFMVAGATGTTPMNRAAMGWLVATYTMHTLGELCISPTGLAFVTRVSPARFVSLLMGLSFLSNSLANWAGGRLAGQVDRIAAGEVQLPWYHWFRLGGQADFFFLFVVSSFGAGLLVLALAPAIKRMLGGRG